MGYTGKTIQCNVRYPEALVDVADLLVHARIFKNRSEYFIWCTRVESFRFGILQFNPNKELPKHMVDDQKAIYEEIDKKIKEVRELIKKGKEDNVEE